MIERDVRLRQMDSSRYAALRDFLRVPVLATIPRQAA